MSESSATPTKVVTDVHTPLGLMWVGDTLYVSEANAVLALAGFDGTTALPVGDWTSRKIYRISA